MILRPGHIFLAFLLVLGARYSAAQDRIGDSLETAFKQAPNDTARVNILNELVAHVEFTDTVKAKKYNDKSIDLAIKANFKKGLARAYFLQGYLFEDKGLYDHALGSYLKTLALRKEIKDLRGEANTYNTIGNLYTAQGKHALAMQNYNHSLEVKVKLGNKNDIADSYYNIALVYESQGNYPKALKNAYTCLKFLEEIKDSADIASTYTFIGLINDGQGNSQEALKFHEAALKISLRLNSKKNIAEAYSNLANTYSNMKRYKESLKKHIRALNLYEEIGDEKGIAVAYNNIGLIYTANGDNEGALKNHFASLKIKEKIKAKSGIAVSCINIGDVYITKRDYEKARMYLFRAKELAEKGGWKEYLKVTYASLTRLDSLRGDFKNAFNHRRLYHLYRDSLDNEEVRRKTTEERLNYDFDKKEAISEAKHTKELQYNKAIADDKNRKKNLVIAFICAGLLLLAIVAIFIYRGNLLKQKANLDLDAKNVLIENQKKEVEEKNKKISESIQYASRIQKTVLPPDEELDSYMPGSYIFFRSKDLVSADFYWFSQLEHELVVVVAESAAKGITGAFVSMIGNTMLNEIVNEKKITDPCAVLSAVHKGLATVLGAGTVGENDKMDVAVITIDKKEKTFSFSGANQCACLVTQKEVMELKGDAVSIGSMDKKLPERFSVITKKAANDTAVYLYTRGFAHNFQLNSDREKMAEFFHKLGAGNVNKEKEMLEHELSRLSNGLYDDVLLLKIKF